MPSIGKNMANVVLVAQNIKCGVLVEKYTTPHWFVSFIDTHSKSHYYPISHVPYDELYRMVLRILNGADVTISFNSEAHINKWSTQPERIPHGLAMLMIDTNLIGLDGGNEELQEDHYNIFSI